MADSIVARKRTYIWHRVSHGHDDYFIVKNGRIILRLWHWAGMLIAT